MKQVTRSIIPATLAVALVACGGDGSSPPQTAGGGNTGGGGGNGTAGGGNTTQNDTCSLANRQQFVLNVLEDWYLFPDLLDRSVNPADHNTVQSYLDALVAPARDRNFDKFFSFITSIQEENELVSGGSSAGFGIRLAFDGSGNRIF